MHLARASVSYGHISTQLTISRSTCRQLTYFIMLFIMISERGVWSQRPMTVLWPGVPVLPMGNSWVRLASCLFYTWNVNQCMNGYFIILFFICWQFLISSTFCIHVCHYDKTVYATNRNLSCLKVKSQKFILINYS